MAVVSNETDDEAFDYLCEQPRCGFASYGWSSKKKAQARGKEHEAEHDSGQPMREMRDVMNEDGGR